MLAPTLRYLEVCSWDVNSGQSDRYGIAATPSYENCRPARFTPLQGAFRLGRSNRSIGTGMLREFPIVSPTSARGQGSFVSRCRDFHSLTSGQDQADPDSMLCQFNHIVHLELFHQVSAVHVDRA